MKLIVEYISHWKDDSEEGTEFEEAFLDLNNALEADGTLNVDMLHLVRLDPTTINMDYIIKEELIITVFNKTITIELHNGDLDTNGKKALQTWLNDEAHPRASMLSSK